MKPEPTFVPEALRMTFTRTMAAPRPEEPERALRLLTAFYDGDTVYVEEKLDGTNVRLHVSPEGTLAHTRGWVDVDAYLKDLGVEPPWADAPDEYDGLTVFEGELLPYDVFSQDSPRLHELAGALEAEVLFDGRPSDTTAEAVYLEGKRYECRPEPLFSKACELDPDHELIQKFIEENERKPEFPHALREGRVRVRYHAYEVDLLEGEPFVRRPRPEHHRECRRLFDPVPYRAIDAYDAETLERELNRCERELKEGLCLKPEVEDTEHPHSVKVRCEWFLRREFEGRLPRTGAPKVVGRLTVQMHQTVLLHENIRDLAGKDPLRVGRVPRRVRERVERALNLQRAFLERGLDTESL